MEARSGVTYGGNSISNAVEQERTMDGLLSRIGRSNSSFGEAITRLQNFRDRLQGATPTPIRDERAAQVPPPLNGIESRLAEFVSENQRLTDELHELITQLERSL